MQNINPPLRRSECERLIRAANYAAPLRTKDLTVSELDAIIEKHYDDEMDLKAMILDGIAADREKNRG